MNAHRRAYGTRSLKGYLRGKLWRISSGREIYPLTLPFQSAEHRRQPGNNGLTLLVIWVVCKSVWLRTPAGSSVERPPRMCAGCGYPSHPGGCQNCPAQGLVCRKCTILGHFGRVCQGGRRPDLALALPLPQVRSGGLTCRTAAPTGERVHCSHDFSNLPLPLCFI